MANFFDHFGRVWNKHLPGYHNRLVADSVVQRLLQHPQRGLYRHLPYLGHHLFDKLDFEGMDLQCFQLRFLIQNLQEDGLEFVEKAYGILRHHSFRGYC